MKSMSSINKLVTIYPTMTFSMEIIEALNKVIDPIVRWMRFHAMTNRFQPHLPVTLVR